ncbi:hypothetical protein D3C75_1078340 [compost metagenome]
MKEHNEKGHLNIFKRDHDSVITGFGKHDRVVAFLPNPEGLYIRVDHLWKLGNPSHEEILKAAKKDQGIGGKWVLDKCEPWDDGSSTDYYFKRP